VSVLVIGESLVDVVRHEDGSSTWLPGGSCANVAVALARLGRPTHLATSLGTDPMGDLIRRHFAESDVQLVRIDSAGVRTSSAVATLDASGAASYSFDIRWAFDADVVDVRPEAVHVGSIGAFLEPGASGVRRLLGRLRGKATVSYDVNARPALMENLQTARRAVEEVVELSDVVKASDEDLALLYPGDAADEVADRWLGSGPVAVAVTRGAEGADGYVRGDQVHVPAERVDVVDTIGAGDTFAAGLIDALWAAGLVGGRPAGLTLEVCRAALEHASSLAAVTVSRHGADPPWRSEVSGPVAGPGRRTP
jgi:fructokinase